MPEKLQNQSSQQIQSKFDQFKSWLKESQVKNADKNIEIAATGQTPLKRVLAKVEGFVNGDSEASDQLNQEMIDYRYETARLQRKAEREAKGQTFEQAVLEDIAKKELAKKQNVEVTAVSPVDSVAETSTFPSIQIDRKPKSTNSTFDRIKAWGALAVLSGSMMLAPNALANNNNSKIENNNPTKVEQVKMGDKTTNDKTNNSEQINEEQTKQIEQLIAGKGVSKGGIKAGLSIKGLEAKFTIRAKHNGESQAKIQYIIKGQVESAKQLIKQGQSETVAYILTSLESDNAKAQKATDESKKQLSDERIYKDAIAGLRGGEVVKAIEVDIVETNIIFNGKDFQSIFTKYISDPKLISQIKNNKYNCQTVYDFKSGKECTIVLIGNKKYVVQTDYVTDWHSSKEYERYILRSFDPSNPITILNLVPESYNSYSTLIKVKYKGSDIYFRSLGLNTKLFDLLNKGKSAIIEGILANGTQDASSVESDHSGRRKKRNELFKRIIISKNPNGEIEVRDTKLTDQNLPIFVNAI